MGDADGSMICCVILAGLIIFGLFWYPGLYLTYDDDNNNNNNNNNYNTRTKYNKYDIDNTVDVGLRHETGWSRCANPCEGQTHRLRKVSEITSIYEIKLCNELCQYDEIMHVHRPQQQCSCPSGYNGPCCECKVGLQDCMMSEWSDWSTCSRKCFGTRNRSRSIEKRSKCGGSVCPFPILPEEEECNHICLNGGSIDYGHKATCNCPDGFTGECCEECMAQDCIMTEWSDWTDCKIVRDARGKQSRTRTIDTPPKCNGTACSTNLPEKRPCDLCGNNGALEPSQNWCRCRHGFSGQFCDCKDIDCELSQWSNWSPCENAVGLHTRSRYVIRNSTCAGKKCNGLLKHPCEGSTPNVNQSSSYVFCGLCVGAFILILLIIYIVCLPSSAAPIFPKKTV